MTKLFVPRLEKYEFPSDEDYEHFTVCEIRNSGRLFECKHCRYVWDHWYGTNISFNESK